MEKGCLAKVMEFGVITKADIQKFNAPADARQEISVSTLPVSSIHCTLAGSVSLLQSRNRAH